MKDVLNALTVDVEDYYMVSGFAGAIPRKDWNAWESRVVPNTRRLLSLFRQENVRATFFVLGCVAEEHPSLVGEILAAGHEVGSHGHGHQLLYDLTPDAFRDDLRRSRAALRAAGADPKGYRAPSFSVTEDTLWALEILKEEGFSYDSSVLPAAHARGGLRGASPAPHKRNGLGELPISTVSVLGRRVPFSGGGYLRLFPSAFTRWGVRRCHAEGLPAVVYVHPWETDPGQPRVPGLRAVDRFRHYVNLSRTEEKLRNLLRSFRFGTAAEALSHALPDRL